MEGITIFIVIAVIWTLISLIWNSKFRESKLKLYPLILIYKSEAFKSIIIKLSQKFRRFWILVGKFSDWLIIFLVVFASGYFIINLFFLLQNIFMVISGVPIGSQFVVVVPFVTISVDKFFFMLILAFMIALFPHELFHGAVAISEEFSIKDAGFVFAIGALGGFVEIDVEDEINKIYDEIDRKNTITLEHKRFLKKFRKVVAAGLFANIILLVAFLGFNHAIIGTGVFEEYGVKIVDLDSQGNAIKSGLRVNDIIIYMNQTRIRTIQDFIEFMSILEPGMIINVSVVRENRIFSFLVEAGNRNGRAYLGVSVQQYIRSNVAWISDSLAFDIYVFIKLNYFVELIIIIFNALPSFILDGAHWVQAYLASRLGKRGIRLAFIINIIFSVILVLNFVAPVIIKMM